MVHINFKSNELEVIEYLKDKDNKSKAIVEAIKIKYQSDLNKKSPQKVVIEL